MESEHYTLERFETETDIKTYVKEYVNIEEFLECCRKCQICDSCSKPDGAPCRFPDKMRFSIESIGGNVGKTTSDLCGIEIEWVEDGKLPEHFVLVGGLLKK